MTLRTALLLWVVMPLLAALAMVGYLTTSTLAESREARMKEDIQLIARAISVPASRALVEGNLERVKHSLDSVFEIGRVYGANVYDKSGDLLLSTGEVPSLSRTDRETVVSERSTQGAYRHSGGRRVYSYFLPLTDPKGDVIGLLEMMRTRREIDSELRSLRVQLVAVLVLCAVGVLSFVLFAHGRAIGGHIERLARDMGTVGAGDVDHRAKLGGPRELTALSAALNDMLDKMASANRQVEEHRQRQRALEGRVRRAEQLAAIGQLASGLAHELGTPLTVVDRQAQRVLRRENLTEAAAGALESVRREVGRMARIVRQLLHYGTRSESRPQSIAAGRLTRRAATAVRELAAERHVDLTVCDAPDDGAALLDVDPGRCEQALVNLLQNAVQAAPEGGEVRIGVQKDDDSVTFVVEDSGQGVPPEIQNRLFEPFFTTKPTGEGSGLGLAVVQGVAEEAEGGISVETSEDLGGARFLLTLPRSSPRSASDPVA